MSVRAIHSLGGKESMAAIIFSMVSPRGPRLGCGQKGGLALAV